MWIPESDDEIYLEKGSPHVRPNRPFLQGDVLVDVPLALIKRFKDDQEYKGTESVVAVALLGHPCSVYSNGSIVNLLTVAEVRELEGAVGATTFVSPWESHWHLFPLPRLFEGRDYVVDFRRIGTTHSHNLEDRRIACLSHVAWGGFQRRYAKHSIRADIEEESWLQQTAKYWNEFDLWEEWNSRGMEAYRYQEWLDSLFESGPYEAVVRREVLEYAPDVLLEDMPAP